ncbi:MAG: DNA-processing protein DprA [Deltaproteobacteria bacterium]|nr:DNA-processing protein DprA [Deltaproteobacteria bacterium]
MLSRIIDPLEPGVAPFFDAHPPPKALEILGTIPVGRRIGIVGSRRGSVRGLEVAAQLADGLAKHGIVVVSGGAIGIDTAALRSATQAGGRCVVVLPTSVDDPLPRQNRELFARIVEAGGALVAESGRAITRGAFLERNRFVAAFSEALVVVEAAERSGTRATVRVARSLGRPVGAVPWSVEHPLAAGCFDVLRAGGRLVTGAADALALIGVEPRSAERPSIVEEIERAGGSAERLAALRGVPIAAVLAELAALELEGVVRRQGSRWIADSS